MHDPVEDAWAAAAVIDFAETFDAEGEAQIADFDDFLALRTSGSPPVRR